MNFRQNDESAREKEEKRAENPNDIQLYTSGVTSPSTSPQHNR